MDSNKQMVSVIKSFALLLMLAIKTLVNPKKSHWVNSMSFAMY